MNNVFILQLAALPYLGLIAAGLLMPKAVGLRKALAVLPEFVRRLFWVYYVFIGTCLWAFGMATFFLAEELASGTLLARAVCAFIALFWTIRLVAAVFIFDVRPYLTNVYWHIGYQMTNIVFSLLPFVYAWVALAPA